MKKAIAIFNRGYEKNGSKGGEDALREAYPNLTDEDITEFYDMMQEYNKELLKGEDYARK